MSSAFHCDAVTVVKEDCINVSFLGCCIGAATEPYLSLAIDSAVSFIQLVLRAA